MKTWLPVDYHSVKVDYAHTRKYLIITVKHYYRPFVFLKNEKAFLSVSIIQM